MDLVEECMGFKYGEVVKARAFPDKIITARVVGFNRKFQVIHLCNEGEYQAALAEGRDPTCIGFPFADILRENAQTSTDGESQHLTNK